MFKIVFVFCCLAALNNVVDSQNPPTLEEMKDILDNYDRDTKLLCNENSKANWDVATDQENEEKRQVQVRRKHRINNKFH